MLYRTHMSLEPQYKVPSLYAFDALARAARVHALKYRCTGEAKSGNSATFLLKLEAVLEGLFQDMMGSVVPDGKVSKRHIKKLISCYTREKSFLLVILPSQDTRVGLPKGCSAKCGICIAPSRACIQPCYREASCEPELPESRITHVVARYNERVTRTVSARSYHMYS